jgi:hypothetical protein
MATTYAQCKAEQARLMAAPYRCVTKIHKAPQITDAGGANPAQGTTDDYLLWVKDGRTTATGAGGYTSAQQVGSPTLTVGLEPRDVTAGQNSCNWRLYAVDETRVVGVVADSEATFLPDPNP